MGEEEICAGSGQPFHGGSIGPGWAYGGCGGCGATFSAGVGNPLVPKHPPVLGISDFADTIDRLTAENERLREAIRAHKREFYGNVNYDDASTANDEALWAAIEDVAPTPPQPRNGGLLSCGCWAYVMPGMRAGRDTFECPRHGRQIIDRCNVDEPSPSTGEDGGK